MLKGNKTWQLALALALFCLLPALSFAWTDSSCTARINITLSGHTQDLFNYQVKIELNSTTYGDYPTIFSQANATRINFTEYNASASDDNIILPFWIKSWNASTSKAIIWVNVSYLNASVPNYIYLYYACNNFNASNYSNVFNQTGATQFWNATYDSGGKDWYFSLILGRNGNPYAGGVSNRAASTTSWYCMLREYDKATGAVIFTNLTHNLPSDVNCEGYHDLNLDNNGDIIGTGRDQNTNILIFILNQTNGKVLRNASFDFGAGTTDNGFGVIVNGSYIYLGAMKTNWNATLLKLNASLGNLGNWSGAMLESSADAYVQPIMNERGNVTWTSTRGLSDISLFETNAVSSPSPIVNYTLGYTDLFRPYQIAKVDSGNITIASEVGQLGAGDRAGRLTKINSTGGILWNVTYNDTSANNKEEMLRGVDVDPFNDIFVTGMLNSHIPVFKYSSGGTLLYNINITNTTSEDWGYGIRTDLPDIYVVGTNDLQADINENSLIYKYSERQKAAVEPSFTFGVAETTTVGTDIDFNNETQQTTYLGIGQTNILSAQLFSNSTINYTWLSTNESGLWINYSNAKYNFSVRQPFVCYQETANISTACGGLNSGSYASSGAWSDVTQTYDGDYSTEDFVNSAGLGYMYVNYTLPANVNLSASHWQVKDSSAIVNLSLAPDCISFANSIGTLPLAVSSHTDFTHGYVSWYCINDSSGTLHSLRDETDPGSGGLVYEEGMNWVIGNYLSPGVWANISFPWSNSTLPVNTSIGWRICANLSSGIYNCSAINTFYTRAGIDLSIALTNGSLVSPATSVTVFNATNSASFTGNNFTWNYTDIPYGNIVIQATSNGILQQIVATNTNSTYSNLTLLFGANNSIFYFYIYDVLGQPINGVTMQFYQQFGGTYVISGTFTSQVDGYVYNVPLGLNLPIQMIINKTGYVTQNLTFTPYNSTIQPIRIRMLTPGTSGITNYNNYINTTNVNCIDTASLGYHNITCIVNNSDSSMNSACLYIDKINLVINDTSCSPCKTGANVLLFCNLGNASGNQYGVRVVGTFNTNINVPLYTGTLDYLTRSISYGNNGLVLSFVIIAVLTTIALFNPEFAVVFGVMGVVVSYLFGFLLVTDFGSIIGLIIAAAVLVYKLSK